jgi:ATP-dependent DNA ligase
MVFAIPLVPLQSYEEAKALWETPEGFKAAYIRLWATQSNATEPLLPGSWAWKKEPETVYLVLLHVRLGSRGTGLDEEVQFSFGAAHEDGFRVVAHGQAPFSADEFSKLQTFIRTHTLERFGPVRTLVPKAVFKVRYRQIQPAPRTKAGIVLSEVEVVAWQPDMTPDEVISLSQLTKNGFQAL